MSWDCNPPIYPYPGTLALIGPDDFTAFSGMPYGANIAISAFE